MIAIIDYQAGNLTSVARALNKLGIKNKITSTHEEILGAERIIFPGVGAAGEAMLNLRSNGLDQVITRAFDEGKPILGICLGTQIIMEFSEENQTTCLGLVPGRVVAFSFPSDSKRGERLKIPHMGWNQVEWVRLHPVFRDILPASDFYFVHSYYPSPRQEEHVVGVTEYGIKFASALAYKNLVAVQFHPEKSGEVGLTILKNFAIWEGK